MSNVKKSNVKYLTAPADASRTIVRNEICNYAEREQIGDSVADSTTKSEKLFSIRKGVADTMDFVLIGCSDSRR